MTVQTHEDKVPYQVDQTWELPVAAQRAIALLMSDATFQAARTDNQALNDFFHGYMAGANALLAIVCGAMSISSEFLEVKND